MLKTNPEHLVLVDISESEDDPLFMLYEDVIFTYKTAHRDIEILIPKGFTTNIGSIPKAARGIISNVNKYNPCYVFHDYVYSSVCVFNIPRGQVDVILRKSLQQFGMSDWKSWSIYLAVKWFGNNHFRK